MIRWFPPPGTRLPTDVESPTEFTMPDPTPTRDRAAAPRPGAEYNQFASYEDGDSLVICDREEPHAWIRSDGAVEIRR